MLEGERQRRDDAWQRTAQLASWVLAGLVKHAPSADRLLGKPAKALEGEEAERFLEGAFGSEEERRAAFDELFEAKRKRAQSGETA